MTNEQIKKQVMTDDEYLQISREKHQGYVLTDLQCKALTLMYDKCEQIGENQFIVADYCDKDIVTLEQLLHEIDTSIEQGDISADDLAEVDENIYVWDGFMAF